VDCRLRFRVEDREQWRDLIWVSGDPAGGLQLAVAPLVRVEVFETVSKVGMRNLGLEIVEFFLDARDVGGPWASSTARIRFRRATRKNDASVRRSSTLSESGPSLLSRNVGGQ